MRKTVLALLSVATVGSCLAQERSDEVKYYRVDFVVKEVDTGKVVNARNYSMTISNEKESTSSIRSGDKVPVQSSSGNGFTYMEVGVNIDCNRAREVADRLAVTVAADISGMGSVEKLPLVPLIRNTRWTAHVLIPLRKPTVIFSSDDAGSKMQMQLEVTATPIK